MTKAQKGREYYNKAMKLYSKAFDGEGDKLATNKFWFETEQAEKNGEIFKKDAELVYKNLREAFRWIRFYNGRY